MPSAFVVQLFWLNAPRGLVASLYVFIGWTAVAFIAALWHQLGLVTFLLPRSVAARTRPSQSRLTRGAGRQQEVRDNTKRRVVVELVTETQARISAKRFVADRPRGPGFAPQPSAKANRYSASEVANVMGQHTGGGCVDLAGGDVCENAASLGGGVDG